MSKATAEDQVNFLVCCVKHAHNGKPDFVAVAKEMGIVSKGAAAKRFERLAKASEIHRTALAEEFPPSKKSRKSSKDATPKTNTAKKRKFEGEADHFQHSQQTADAMMLRYPNMESERNPMFIKSEPYGFGKYNHHVAMSPLPLPQFQAYHGAFQHMPGPPMLIPPYPATLAQGQLQNHASDHMNNRSQYGHYMAQNGPNYMLSHRLPSPPAIPHRLSGISITEPIPSFVDPFLKQENHGDNFSSDSLGSFAPHPFDQPGTASMSPREVIPNVIESTTASAPVVTSIPDVKVEIENVTKDNLADRNCILIAD